jgi:hypothetical protein
MSADYPKEFLALLNSVKAKRPRTIIQHILEHGFITSQEIQDIYGYHHPPRAVRDVREHGIPLVTYREEGNDGKRIAVYKFGDPDDARNALSRSAGRTVLSKTLKQALIEKYGPKCFIYFEPMDENILQVDHRIPYEISGEQGEQRVELYMLLSPSANRAKSWTCEHCENWVRKDPAFCVKCFWASPESYEHIAGTRQRIISVMFTGEEVESYQQLIAISGVEGAQQVIKRLIRDHLK